MTIQEIKELLMQFDQSTLREFSFKTSQTELYFSKNETVKADSPATLLAVTNEKRQDESVVQEDVQTTPETVSLSQDLSGELVESPLVGVTYLSPGPGKDHFITVGDQVKKGQTLLIIEAMKVMNEIPAPKDGTITEILVSNEEIVEFGKGLVRIQ